MDNSTISMEYTFLTNNPHRRKHYDYNKSLFHGETYKHYQLNYK